MSHMLIVPPAGGMRIVPYNGREPPLEVLQELVGGGYVELIKVRYAGADRRAFVDEDGRLKRLPFNGYATTMAKPFGYGEICGTMVVLMEGAQYK